MEIFRSIEELEQHMKRLGVRQFEHEMQQVAEEMKECVEREIGAYYRSYSPNQYERTGKFLESVEVLEVTQEPDRLEATIGYNQDASHPSLYGGSGYVPTLINSGWRWKKTPKNGHIERFTYFGGDHFADRAIARFSSSHPDVVVTYET